MSSLHPTVLWAQRKDRLYLTFDLQDCKDPQISVENNEETKSGKVSFKGHAHSHATGPEEHTYVIELDFYDEIDKEDVKEARTDRTITLAIAKKESGPHWPRLLKANGKAPPYVKVNWDKWVDEDEEDEAEDGFSGQDFSQFQGMGGAGGMGGMQGLEGLLSGMGGAGGAGGLGDSFPGMGEEGDDSGDEDDLPELEASTDP